MLAIHGQINLQVRVRRLLHHRLLDLLLPDDVLWIELLHELPLIWILIRRLQHFHVWCELGARLAHVRHVLLFGGGGVRHDGRTIESVA